MSESTTPPPAQPENPHDDDLDVEGPNESTPNHVADPRRQDDADGDDS